MMMYGSFRFRARVCEDAERGACDMVDFAADCQISAGRFLLDSIHWPTVTLSLSPSALLISTFALGSFVGREKSFAVSPSFLVQLPSSCWCSSPRLPTLYRFVDEEAFHPTEKV